MITDRQMKRTLMIELFSTTGLFLSAMAQNMQQLLVGMAGALIYAIYFLWLGQNYNIERVGKVRKTIYTIRFFLYACFLGSLMKLLVSKMLLKGASGWFLFFPVLVLTIYANRGGREERARLMELLFWFVFLPLFFVLALAIKDVHFNYLIQNDFQPTKSVQVFLCFCSMEILIFFHGKRKEKAKALTFVFLLNILVFVVTIGMYGYRMAESSDFPVVTMIQMVRFPGGFVERLDIFILAFWILSLFAIFSAYCFYGTYYWSKEISSEKSLKRNPIAWIFYGVVFVAVGWNRFDLTELMADFQTYLLWIDIPLAIILPWLGDPKQKRFAAVTALSVIMLIATGCAPKHINIEERDYVLAMGIEMEQNVWKVSFFLPENECIVAQGKNWEEVETNFQKGQAKELELGHLKAMIIGKNANWKQLQNQWKVDQDYAKTVLLFQTDKSMEEFVKADQSSNAALGNTLVELAERNHRETTLGDYLAGAKKVPKITIRTDLPMVE
ncbi:MAG: GerAB/ArcD/ProY family transporter [Lachnospiraceae bacterium]|nr:GerAB/ArcD/ProY family transporter [Lachnospiraceae bacterium]